MLRRVILLMAITSGSFGCDRVRESEGVGAARVVDSFVPREEATRRFRRDLSAVSELQGAQPSRDSLVASVVRALITRDTAALAGIAVTPAEFSYLYYPTTPQSLPPYDLEPGLMWGLLQERSERGLRRALDQFGGRRLRLVGYDCGPGSSREGENTVVGPCVVQFRDPSGKPVSAQLLSQVLERGGRYKVLSYANKL
jgi:hypothetical protein